MTKLNVVKSVKEWYKEKGLGDSGEARSRDVSDNNINLNSIKLKVRGDTKWSPIPPTTSSDHVARVENMAGDCGASNENGSFQKVTITEGTIEGLNTTIKLDLQGTGLSGELGNDVEIDPSKSESCIKREKSGTGRYKEYRGSFACDIEMKGIVTIRESPKAAVTQDISEIFKDLKSETSELEHLTFEGKKVVTKMHGLLPLGILRNCGIKVDMMETIDLPYLIFVCFLVPVHVNFFSGVLISVIMECFSNVLLFGG